MGEQRWEDLFADLDAQMAMQNRLEADAETADRTRREQALVGWVGAAMGLLASLASASRGGWVMLPPLMLLILWLQRAPGAAPAGRRAARAVLVTATICTVLATLPVVQQRAELAADELQRQAQQGAGTSVGLRVAFWRQAWADGLEQPWVGVGQLGYEQRQRAAVAQGTMPALAIRYNHAHNEWLDMFAKRGLLGVLGLLLFYAVPGVLFGHALRQAGIASVSAHSLLNASVAQVTANLDHLARELSKLTFGDLLAAATNRWRALSALLDRDGDAAALGPIDAAAEELLVAAEALTAALAAASPLATLAVINRAGRQRMLSQRLAKQALLGTLAEGEAGRRAAMDAVAGIQEFEAALVELERSPLSTPDIRAGLADAVTIWRRLTAALRGAPDGCCPGPG
jgi:hypothetical protein